MKSLAFLWESFNRCTLPVVDTLWESVRVQISSVLVFFYGQQWHCANLGIVNIPMSLLCLISFQQKFLTTK